MATRKSARPATVAAPVLSLKSAALDAVRDAFAADGRRIEALESEVAALRTQLTSCQDALENTRIELRDARDDVTGAYTSDDLDAAREEAQAEAQATIDSLRSVLEHLGVSDMAIDSVLEGNDATTALRSYPSAPRARLAPVLTLFSTRRC